MRILAFSLSIVIRVFTNQNGFAKIVEVLPDKNVIIDMCSGVKFLILSKDVNMFFHIR